jgi:hypothetical protein
MACGAPATGSELPAWLLPGLEAPGSLNSSGCKASRRSSANHRCCELHWYQSSCCNLLGIEYPALLQPVERTPAHRFVYMMLKIVSIQACRAACRYSMLAAHQKRHKCKAIKAEVKHTSAGQVRSGTSLVLLCTSLHRLDGLQVLTHTSHRCLSPQRPSCFKVGQHLLAVALESVQ